VSEIPPYIDAAVVAKACVRKADGTKMTTRDARRMLHGAGILERPGGARRGKPTVVADSRLRERLPDVYDRVFAYFAQKTSEDQGEP
jgi:hypothetical protein